MEEFIDNVKVLINVLGYKVLEPTLQISSETSVENEKLYITTGSANASGMVTSEGFVLLEGATINEKTSEKSLSKGATALRKQLLASDKVRNFVTTENILFSSSSAAADFVVGYSVSGPATWKTTDGTTLKELESQIAQ